MPRGPRRRLTPSGCTAICRITPEKQLSKVLRFGEEVDQF